MFNWSCLIANLNMKQVLIWFNLFVGFGICTNASHLCPDLKERILAYSDIMDLYIATQISTQWHSPAKSVFCRHQRALNTLQRSIQSLNDESWFISINQTIQLASSKDILWNYNVLDQLLCDISDNYELIGRDYNSQLIDLLTVYCFEFNQSSIVSVFKKERELANIKALIIDKTIMHRYTRVPIETDSRYGSFIHTLHCLYQYPELSHKFKRFKQNSLLWIKKCCKNKCYELWDFIYYDFDVTYDLVRYEIPIKRKRWVIDIIIKHAFANTDKRVRRKDLCLLKKIYNCEYIIKSALENDHSANKLSGGMVDLMDILFNREFGLMAICEANKRGYHALEVFLQRKFDRLYFDEQANGVPNVSAFLIGDSHNQTSHVRKSSSNCHCCVVQ
eukprot:315613_1